MVIDVLCSTIANLKERRCPIILQWQPLWQLHEFSDQPEPLAIAQHQHALQEKLRIAQLEESGFRR